MWQRRSQRAQRPRVAGGQTAVALRGLHSKTEAGGWGGGGRSPSRRAVPSPPASPASRCRRRRVPRRRPCRRHPASVSPGAPGSPPKPVDAEWLHLGEGHPRAPAQPGAGPRDAEAGGLKNGPAPRARWGAVQCGKGSPPRLIGSGAPPGGLPGSWTKAEALTQPPPPFCARLEGDGKR